MAFDLNDAWGWIQKLISRVSRLESGAMLENSSITNGRMRFIGGTLRVDSGGSVEIVGSLQIDGATVISGTFNLTANGWVISGNGTISGNTIVSGTLNVTGNSAFGGTLSILGSTTIGGAVTMNNDLTLGSGRIVAGSIVIDKNGGYGGRLAASTLLFDTSSSLFTGTLTATNGITSAAGDIVATLGDIRAPFGDIGGASKSFWIDHPTKPGKQLRHGSLEGPEHAVYYRGVVEFDEDGETVFELPDYFEALVIEGDEPTVQITPIGRPFAAGAERVADGRVTVYGERNREAHVTVTAARGLFDVEPDKEVPVTDLP